MPRGWTIAAMDSAGILVVRLGAMGDIIHALPAITSLKLSFPDRRLIWALHPRWMPLLEGNPYVDQTIHFDRLSLAALRRSSSSLRSLRPALAIDFQGLIKSALIARLSRPRVLWGFDKSIAREPLASFIYTKTVKTAGPHRVDRNLQLAQAAGANTLTRHSWLPQGRPEGLAVAGDFVLASPFAGWAGKQWPLANYKHLGELLRREGLRLVANASEQHADVLRGLENIAVHTSSIAGLIDATRRAVAVVGVDSGPLHLAAALEKPGVAIFGPTDPVQTGPYGETMAVVRAPGWETTYRRDGATHPSMEAVTLQEVFSTLMRVLERQAHGAGPRV